VKKQDINYCCCCCCCCAGSQPNRDEEPRDEEVAAALGGRGPFLSAPSALSLFASELGFALRSPISGSATSAAGSGGLTCCRSSSCGQRASWRRGSSSGRWERCSRQACSARNVLVSDEVQRVGCRVAEGGMQRVGCILLRQLRFQQLPLHLEGSHAVGLGCVHLLDRRRGLDGGRSGLSERRRDSGHFCC
jgi:hypothetical protein